MKTRRTKSLKKVWHQVRSQEPAAQPFSQAKSVSNGVQRQQFDDGMSIQLQHNGFQVHSKREQTTFHTNRHKQDSLIDMEAFDAWEPCCNDCHDAPQDEPRQHEQKNPESKEKGNTFETGDRPTEKQFKAEAQSTDWEEQLLEKDLEDLLNATTSQAQSLPDPAPPKQSPQPKTEPETPPAEKTFFDELDDRESYGTTYDLGTLALSKKFEEFDHQLDLEEMDAVTPDRKDPVFEDVTPLSQGQTTQAAPLPGGKVFDVQGKLLGPTTREGQEVIILTDRKLAKQYRKAGRKGQRVLIDIAELDASDYFILPPWIHRQEIQRIMQNDDTKSHIEYGGRGFIPVDTNTRTLLFDQMAHIRAIDGQPAGPDDNAATIQINTSHADEREQLDVKVPSGFYAVDYTWHSHPGGEWKRNEGEREWKTPEAFNREQLRDSSPGTTVYGGPGIETKSYEFGPSQRDIEIAHQQYARTAETVVEGAAEAHALDRNFVLHKKQGWVFFYTHETEPEQGAYEAKIKLEDFYNLRADQP